MDDGQWKNEIREEIKTFATWGCCALIDSCFLIIWVGTQWVTARVIDRMEISGVDAIIFLVFQILLAFTTLVPVMMYVYRTTLITWMRTKHRIKQEKEIIDSYAISKKVDIDV